LGDAYRHIDALFRGNAAEERQVLARARTESVLVELNAVVNRRHPVGVRSGNPLRITDRDERHIRKVLEQRLELGEVEPSVQGGHHGTRARPSQVEAEEVEVGVDDVKFTELAPDLPQRYRPERCEVRIGAAVVPQARSTVGTRWPTCANRPVRTG